MKTLFLLCCAYVLMSFPLSAQQKIDIDYFEIAKQTTDSVRYNSLLERFRNLDRSLTLEEMALLYYGFPFQKDYVGATKYEYLGLQIMSGIKEGDNENMLKACNIIINQNPFALQIIDLALHTSSNLGQPMQTRIPYFFQLFKTLDVIEASGDGKTPETAFKVLTISDEYRFLRFKLDKIQYTTRESVSDQDTMKRRYDKFTVAPNEKYDATELWFDKYLFYEPAKNISENNVQEN